MQPVKERKQFTVAKGKKNGKPKNKEVEDSVDNKKDLGSQIEAWWASKQKNGHVKGEDENDQ